MRSLSSFFIMLGRIIFRNSIFIYPKSKLEVFSYKYYSLLVCPKSKSNVKTKTSKQSLRMTRDTIR